MGISEGLSQEAKATCGDYRRAGAGTLDAFPRQFGVALVYLPAYSPELNPVERVFCEVRRCVEGVVYGSLEAKLAAVEGALEGLRDGMVRLVGWDWIREALEGLPCD